MPAQTEYESPILLHIETKTHKVIVEDKLSGKTLAWCYIGDDLNVERIADILSQKRLAREAMKLRQVAQDARRKR